MLKNVTAATRPLFAILCAATLVLGVATVGYSQSGPLEDLANFPRTQLEIRHGKDKKNPRNLTIWLADTPERQEQGLMFVRDLPAGEGMLFPQKKPRQMSMWMKNTYIELDMVFIGEKGAIDQIIERVQPLSLEILKSRKTVAAVLEIKGGEASRLGLKEGDRVAWTPPAS
jgi:uncharacterized membrane protein (UPF0127 family)